VFSLIDLNLFLPRLSSVVDLVTKTKFPVDITRACRCWLQLAPCICINI